MERLFKIFARELPDRGRAAVVFAPDGVSCAYLPQQEKTGPVCEFFQTEEIGQHQKIVQRFVTKQQLAGAKVTWVLHPDSYRLLLLDLPAVPKPEYRSALRWQVKDVIDYPLEEAVVDVFLAPTAVLDYYKKAFVIVARKTVLERGVNLLRATGLSPSIIDIYELAMRNLLVAAADKLQLDSDSETVAMLQFLQNKTALLLIRAGEIYLARDINFVVEKSSTTEQLELLAQEIKKSIAYYQQQLRQEKPRKIVVLQREFTAQLAELLEMEALKFELPKDNPACWMAAGGVLRQEQS